MKDCEFSLFYGTGSNGKTTLFTFLDSVFKGSSYVVSLNHDCFSIDAEFRKVLRGIPQNCRFLLCEELTDIKSMSYLKKLYDGTINLRALRGYDMETYKISAKPLIASSEILDLGEDTGIFRRANYIECSSSFVDDWTRVDESRQIFFKDVGLRERIESMSSVEKCAVFNVFAAQASMFLNRQRVPPTKDVVNGLSLPTVNKFVETILIKMTNCRVSKNDMLSAFREYYWTFGHKLTDRYKSIITSQTSKGILYMPDWRDYTSSTKGVFVGYRIKTIDVDDGNSTTFGLREEMPMMTICESSVDSSLT